MCLRDEKYVYLLLMLCETIDIIGFDLGGKNVIFLSMLF